MSLKVKPSNRQRSHVSSRGFSSSSMGAYSIPRISSATNQVRAVTVNKNLLTPIKIDIDPSIQAVRSKEKDQIKGLNNRFASFIEKVRHLEQQNKMLDTKWTLLQQQTNSNSSIESMLKAYIANLQKHLEQLNNDQELLELEKRTLLENLDEYKTLYEQEVNRKTDAENAFVTLKKDVDRSYMSKLELEQMVSAITDEIDFLRAVYDQELHELQSSVKDVSVVVEVDNSRDLNMDHIIAEVKAQYEAIALQSRREAESWYKIKFDQMAAQADEYTTELRSTRGEISELTRKIRQLQGEVSGTKTQSANLQVQVNEAEILGENTVQDARARIKDLEEALQKAKQDMARQIREYQDLMNLKMTLDIEISTYRKLLEGEEERLAQGTAVTYKSVATKAKATPSVQNHTQRKLAAVVIKTVETQDISYK